MLYHPQHRIAYLLPPRTATRSVARWLESLGFQEHHGRHGTCAERLSEARRVFCTVRNHWDALVSWWGSVPCEYEAGACSSFDEWLRRYYLSGESVCRAYHEADGMWSRWLHFAHRTIRYEHLEQDLREAFPLESHLPKLKHIGATTRREGRDYRELYTPSGAAAVYDLYGREIDALGYTFNGAPT